MSRTYRDHLDSREAFDAYEPTAEDWAEFEAWLDSLDEPTEDEINAMFIEAWHETADLF